MEAGADEEVPLVRSGLEARLRVTAKESGALMEYLDALEKPDNAFGILENCFQIKTNT